VPGRPPPQPYSPLPPAQPQPPLWQPSPAPQQQQLQAQQPHSAYSVQGPPPQPYLPLSEQQQQPMPTHAGPPQLPPQQCPGPGTSTRSNDYGPPLQPPQSQAGRGSSLFVLPTHPVPSPNPPFPPQPRPQSTPQQQERRWQQVSPPACQQGQPRPTWPNQPQQPASLPPQLQPYHTAPSPYPTPSATSSAGVSSPHPTSDAYSGRAWPPTPVPGAQGRQPLPNVHQWPPPVGQGQQHTSPMAGPPARNNPTQPQQLPKPSGQQAPRGNCAPPPRPSGPPAPPAQYTPSPHARQAWPPVAAVRPPVSAPQPQPPVPTAPLASARARCAMCDTSFAVQDAHGAERLCPDCLACVF
jgi:hypothetical protein